VVFATKKKEKKVSNYQKAEKNANTQTNKTKKKKKNVLLFIF